MFGRISALILLIFSTAFSESGYNQNYVYSPLDSLIWQGIVQVDAEDFDSALTIFNNVIQADSTSPRGYFFVAATYSTLVSDYRNFNYRDEFTRNVDRAIEIGERKEKSGNATAEDIFYYGGAVGYRGIFRSHDGDWWGAFKDGLRGRKLLGRAHKADSSYMDVYLGLGTYDYWRSAKTKVLWWLPFFSDKRDKGIEEIKMAIEHGKLASHEGKYTLMRIYFDYGKYDTAVEHWEDSVKELNPEDPFSHYWLGRSYIELGQYEKALRSFEIILSVYLQSPYYDPGGEMECRYFLGLCQRELGNLAEAVEHLSRASEMARDLPDRKDMEEIVKKIDPLLKKTRKELGQK
jgi:tetratricopeptide (TPR) repeat protein